MGGHALSLIFIIASCKSVYAVSNFEWADFACNVIVAAFLVFERADRVYPRRRGAVLGPRKDKDDIHQ